MVFLRGNVRLGIGKGGSVGRVCYDPRKDRLNWMRVGEQGRGREAYVRRVCEGEG